MVVLVCGSKSFHNADLVIDRLLDLPPGVEIVHGDARGADTLGGKVAKELGMEVKSYPITPMDWLKYGKRAGEYRNIQMYHDSHPDLVIGFRSHLNSKGTNHMIKYAKSLGTPVEIIDDFEKKEVQYYG
jgi:hypothetical protein